MRWPIITIGTPASTAAQKGARSLRTMVSTSWTTTGRAMCESLRAGPWLGKCFAAETMLASFPLRDPTRLLRVSPTPNLRRRSLRRHPGRTLHLPALVVHRDEQGGGGLCFHREVLQGVCKLPCLLLRLHVVDQE